MKKIIKYLLCWLKAGYFGLSYDEFCALCEEFEKGQCSAHKKECRFWIAQHALKKYLRAHTPAKSEIDRIYAGSFELRWLYLESIPRGRQLPDYEQHMLVCKMPTGGPYRFPSALGDKALDELFSSAQAKKIGDYVQDFVLPPSYEMRLIELCHQEKGEQKDWFNSYRRVLLCYLNSKNDYKLIMPDAQLFVLALDDEELAVAMVGNCRLANNFLFAPTLEILVEQGSLKTLQTLFFNSYIESDELADKILERFPQLQEAYNISRLRRPLYKLEREVGEFLGTEAPSMKEHQFILRCIEADIDEEKRKEFVDDQVLPMLALPRTTPYFCAWCAYNFPETGKSAYQRVRQIAKAYRNKYKS